MLLPITLVCCQLVPILYVCNFVRCFHMNNRLFYCNEHIFAQLRLAQATWHDWMVITCSDHCPLAFLYILMVYVNMWCNISCLHLCVPAWLGCEILQFLYAEEVLKWPHHVLGPDTCFVTNTTALQPVMMLYKHTIRFVSCKSIKNCSCCVSKPANSIIV